MKISEQELKYLELLSENYKTIGEASAEIINLMAIQSPVSYTHLDVYKRQPPI